MSGLTPRQEEEIRYIRRAYTQWPNMVLDNKLVDAVLEELDLLRKQLKEARQTILDDLIVFTNEKAALEKSKQHAWEENVRLTSGVHYASGNHLAVIRSWIQQEAHNGSTVEWGSEDFLKLRPQTVADMERLAQRIVDSISKNT